MSNSGQNKEKTGGLLGSGFRPLLPVLPGVMFVSMIINVLMLTGPMFMLQVYDRVLSSGSVPTLVVLAGLAITLYAVYGFLETLRGRILLRLGQRIDARLSSKAYEASNLLPIRFGKNASTLHPVQDLDTIRQFLSGPGPAAICDAPWMPLYFGIIFLIHPVLGAVALGGGVVIAVLMMVNEFLTRRPSLDVAACVGRRSSDVEAGRRNAEALNAMGMQPALSQKWDSQNEDYLAKQRNAADLGGQFGTFVKTFRLVLQSAMLGVGAFLALKQEISPGTLIASSILASRGLAPIEQAVAQWKGLVASRQALKRLNKVLGLLEGEKDGLALPLPEKRLEVENMSCGPVGEKLPVVNGVNLTLAAGEGLGVIGPSGSGKSTLARALVGLSPALKGTVRFDGAKLSQWQVSEVGAFVGYLPQDLQLFEGTVAENIARFQANASSESVIEAARLADVHDLIVNLPDGYNTFVGRGGRALSAGQQQRIALARALFGNPFLVVLDEPNSNLDAEGEAALTNAIKAMRERGSVVIVIAHRPSAIAAVDKVMCLQGGTVLSVGAKEDILKQTVQPIPQRVRQA